MKLAQWLDMAFVCHDSDGSSESSGHASCRSKSIVESRSARGGIIQIQRTLISSPHVVSNACNERMLERCVSQFVMAHRMLFIKAFIVHAMFSHFVRYHTQVGITHVITSRAWGTLGLGTLLALILGLIARIPQSDVVLIAAIRCIGISSSNRAAGLLLLGVLLVTKRLLLIVVLGLGERRGVVVLVLVI